MLDNTEHESTPDGVDDAGEDLITPRSNWPKVVGIVAAALVAVGGGAWGTVALLGGDDVSLDLLPSPTASVSPTASATRLGEPWGDSAGLAAPGEVTVDPLLPDALPLPDGLLEDTGRGWVLATYSPTYLPPASTDWTYVADVQVLYLISPEGERYQLLELDSSRPMELLMWNAGDDHAIVRDERAGYRKPESALEPEEDWFSLDLSTGIVEPFSPSIPEEAWPAGVTAAGLRLWMTSLWTEEEGLTNTLYVTDLDGALLNTIVPEGRLTVRDDQKAMGNVDLNGNRLAWVVDRDLTVVGLEGGDPMTVPMDIPEDKSCVFSGWLDDMKVLVLCGDGDNWLYSEMLLASGAAYYEVDVSTGTAIERGGPATDMQFFEGFRVGTALVGQLNYATPSGAGGDDTGAYTFDGLTLRPVPELQEYAFFESSYGTQSVYLSRDEVLDDVLYGRFGGIGNDGGSATLVRWDSSSHEVTVLIPGHGYFPIDGMWVVRDILSVVVAQ